MSYDKYRSLKHWLLCEKYTVAEAAYLILEIVPNIDDEGISDFTYKEELKALQKALDQAGVSGAIKAETERDINGYQWVAGLYKDSLIQWLEKNRVKAPLFLPDSPQAGGSQTPPYLNKDHPYYSPKLALAVRAWEAVALGDEYQNSSRTVKQNIEDVARSLAVEVELVGDGEKVPDAAIDQVAKVANWNTAGGAPKTPTKS